MSRDDESGRIWALRDAVVSIGSDLDLDSVLDRIVRAACELSGARYGALGVLGPDGRWPAGIHVHGLSKAEMAAIGHWPEGHGLLGLLVKQPGPLRLRDISEHPKAYGFPENHPPMKTLLGVPVRIRDRVFGNLYLTEKRDGAEFTAEDEHLVSALAAAAGMVIDHARLYRQTEIRRRWQEAAAAITRSLLGELEPGDALHLIASRARDVAGGHLGAVLLADGDDLVTVAIDGDGLEGLLGLRMPAGEPPVSSVVNRVETVVVEDLAKLVKEQSDVPLSPAIEDLGRAVIVPMPAGVASSGGVLVVAAHRDQPLASGDESTELIASFANQATLALDRAQAQQDRATLAVLEDRDRIARELHDLVIQRLFATGLQLEGTHRMSSPPVQERLRRAVEDIDSTIADLRAAIFELHKDPERASLREDLAELLEEYAGALGFEPALELRGPLDTVIPANVRPQILATVREALSNVAQHAKAAGAKVEVVVLGREVVARITDDGIGISWNGRESGLRNLRTRASGVGGAVVVERAQPHGTVLEFRAPLVPDSS